MARWRISEAYFYWKKNMPHDDFVKKNPQKAVQVPQVAHGEFFTESGDDVAEQMGWGWKLLK